MRQHGKEMGSEFVGKGARVALGPGATNISQACHSRCDDRGYRETTPKARRLLFHRQVEGTGKALTVIPS